MLVMSLGNQYIQHFKIVRKNCWGYLFFGPDSFLSFIFLKENYLSLEFRDTGLREALLIQSIEEIGSFELRQFLLSLELDLLENKTPHCQSVTRRLRISYAEKLPKDQVCS